MQGQLLRHFSGFFSVFFRGRLICTEPYTPRIFRENFIWRGRSVRKQKLCQNRRILFTTLRPSPYTNDCGSRRIISKARFKKMGKLVLGIVAVIFLQIAFSIYLAMDTGDQAAVNVGRGAIDGTNVIADTRVALADESDSSNRAAESMADLAGRHRLVDSVRIKSNERYTMRPPISGKQNRRPYHFVATRSPALRRGASPVELSFKREYFGGTVVEIRFEVSDNRGEKTPKSKIRREVFGKVTVEHKFAI
jgi:hypothetical protein